MNTTRHSVNFRQAVYELFGIGHDLTHLLSEEDRALADKDHERGVFSSDRLHRLSGAVSTAHCTVRIYAQFMPELRSVVAG